MRLQRYAQRCLLLFLDCYIFLLPGVCVCTVFAVSCVLDDTCIGRSLAPSPPSIRATTYMRCCLVVIRFVCVYVWLTGAHVFVSHFSACMYICVCVYECVYMRMYADIWYVRARRPWNPPLSSSSWRQPLWPPRIILLALLLRRRLLHRPNRHYLRTQLITRQLVL